MFTIPHEESNIVRTSIGTNTQKRRKAKNDLDKRQNYWNGQGKFQVEYDTRLDALPDEGVAGTVSILSSSYIYKYFMNVCDISGGEGGDDEVNAFVFVVCARLVIAPIASSNQFPNENNHINY